ncbi:Holliday junction resolvase RuvX [Rickettsiales bacterium]|nr:Holliday junction resolvase RuvX [Rickettsiales bacterium]
MLFEQLEDFKENIGQNKRLMGIDFGQARIGIAFSDEGGMISTPFETYNRQNINKDLGYINRLIKERNLSGIVIGLPLELDGTESQNCQIIRDFVKKLQKKTYIAIFLQDERMSTAAVTRVLMQTDMTRKKRQSVDDKLAASYILQGVLDRM